MAKIHKYGAREFEKDFPSEEACLKRIFLTLHTEQCSCGGKYRKLQGRRQYQCSKCRYQIAPTAGTIFHKSDTPLRMWFLAIMIFSNAKSGLSAKQLERELNVTYKTAWRMLRLIRKALADQGGKLGGIVEIDGAYLGGRFRSGKYNEKQKEAIAAKTVVLGAVERNGGVRTRVVENMGGDAMQKFIEENIKEGSHIFTDTSPTYRRLKGYERHTVQHNKQEYVRGAVHINTMEAFWSHVKRSVTGTHKVISKKYLQSYLDGFAFHYNNRGNDNWRFSSLLGALLRVQG